MASLPDRSQYFDADANPPRTPTAKTGLEPSTPKSGAPALPPLLEATARSPGLAFNRPAIGGARLPEDDWQKAINDQARLANVAIEVDRILGFGERGEARLMVSRSDLREVADDTPEVLVMDRQLPVTYSVRAQAHSRKLKVSPEGYVEKTLTGTNVAIWTWQIEGTDKADTSATLTVDLEHKIFVDGKPLFIPVQTFPHTVIVKVSYLDRLADWTAGLATIEKLLLAMAAVIAAGGGVWLAILNWPTKPKSADKTS